MFNLDTRQFDILVLLVGCELPKLLGVTQTIDYEDRWTHNTSISTKGSREVKVMDQPAQVLEQVLVLECNMHSEVWN